MRRVQEGESPFKKSRNGMSHLRDHSRCKFAVVDLRLGGSRGIYNEGREGEGKKKKGQAEKTACP